MPSLYTKLKHVYFSCFLLYPLIIILMFVPNRVANFWGNLVFALFGSIGIGCFFIENILLSLDLPKLIVKLLTIIVSIIMVGVSLMLIYISLPMWMDVPNVIMNNYYIVEGYPKNIEITHGKHSNIKFSIKNKRFDMDTYDLDIFEKGYKYKVKYLPNSNYVLDIIEDSI